jgi:hypothetical protein
VTARYAKDGATKEEVVSGVKSVRRKFTVFKSIEVIDGGETWDYKYVASEGEREGPKQKRKEGESRVIRAFHGTNGDAILGIITEKKMIPSSGKIYLAKSDFGQKHLCMVEIPVDVPVLS